MFTCVIHCGKQGFSRKTNGSVDSTVLSKNQTSAWHEARRPHQFSLRALFEILVACSVVFAALRLHNLVACTLAFALVTVWAMRVPDWRIQISLMMLFGGFCAVSMGACFVVGAFQLATQVLWTNRLPDVLVFLGPIIALTGAFYTLFGSFHLIIALIDRE